MSRLLPCLAELLEALGADAGDIDAVVVGKGPGSFTGVRIGVATAKGLAHGLDAPLFGVGTLDAIAQRFLGEGDLLPAGGILGVVGDAMRGEVYPTLFRVSEAGVERLAEDRVAKPADAAAEWAAAVEAPLLLTGDGLVKYRDVFEAALGERAAVAPPGLWTPSGEGLVAAFLSAMESGTAGSGDVGAVLPVYTRLSDAEEAERARRGLPPIDPPATGVAEPPREAAGS